MNLKHVKNTGMDVLCPPSGEITNQKVPSVASNISILSWLQIACLMGNAPPRTAYLRGLNQGMCETCLSDLEVAYLQHFDKPNYSPLSSWGCFSLLQVTGIHILLKVCCMPNLIGTSSRELQVGQKHAHQLTPQYDVEQRKKRTGFESWKDCSVVKSTLNHLAEDQFQIPRSGWGGS